MSDGRIEELRTELKSAREAYYNLSQAMSDQEYDAKKDELAKLSPDDEEVVTVGATPPKYSVWEKVAHEIPMGSLSKVNEPEEFKEWVGKTGVVDVDPCFLITYKIDGSSLEAVYEDGKIVRCVTRGDGKIGEDITHNASQIPTLPKEIPPVERKMIVRGEVVMTKSVFEEKYTEEYANPRNTAAGKVRDKKGGGKECQDLTFLAFTLVSDQAPYLEDTRFRILRKMGFHTPDWWTGDSEEVAKWHRKVEDKLRSTLDYEIDGTVVRLNDMAAQKALGDLNMRPRGQVAWKFDPAMGVTRILDVKWQVGNSGRVTPVAVLEPVNVGGVTITNVSLHNLSLFKDLGLWAGCDVLVSRRNDVIPYIEKNLSAEAAEEATAGA